MKHKIMVIRGIGIIVLLTPLVLYELHTCIIGQFTELYTLKLHLATTYNKCPYNLFHIYGSNVYKFY